MRVSPHLLGDKSVLKARMLGSKRRIRKVRLAREIHINPECRLSFPLEAVVATDEEGKRGR